MFCFADTRLLRPLPVARPGEVLTITGVAVRRIVDVENLLVSIHLRLW
jgi:hypothetical protein